MVHDEKRLFTLKAYEMMSHTYKSVGWALDTPQKCMIIIETICLFVNDGAHNFIGLTKLSRTKSNMWHNCWLYQMYYHLNVLWNFIFGVTRWLQHTRTRHVLKMDSDHRRLFSVFVFRTHFPSRVTCVGCTERKKTKNNIKWTHTHTAKQSLWAIRLKIRSFIWNLSVVIVCSVLFDFKQNWINFLWEKFAFF